MLHCWSWEEYTCQKGALMVNWIQIHNQSLATIVCRTPSFMHAEFQEKATDRAAQLPVLCSWHLSQLLYKRAPRIKIQPIESLYPHPHPLKAVQLYPHLYLYWQIRVTSLRTVLFGPISLCNLECSLAQKRTNQGPG